MACEEAPRRPEQLATLAHEGLVTSLACKGDVLAAASNDGLITLWRLPVGERLVTLRRSQPVCCLAISADFVACGCRDGVVPVWTCPDGRLLRELRHCKSVCAIALLEHDEGCILATGSEDFTVGLWHLLSGEKRADLTFQESVGTLVLSELYLVVGCDDGELSVWSCALKSPERLVTLALPKSRCWATAAAMEGELLVCARSDRSVVGFRLPFGEQLFTSRFDDMILSIALQGCLLACGSRDGGTTLWRLPLGTPLLSIKQDVAENSIGAAMIGEAAPIFAVTLQDGILACAPNDMRVTTWKVSDDELLRCLGRGSFEEPP